MLPTRLSNSFCPVSLQPSQPGMLVRIYPTEGIGQPIPIDDHSLMVGRDEISHIYLPDDSVSRRHATIEWEGSSHRVIDLASTNGTFVNEVRIQDASLRSGDRLRFGKQIFKYLTADEIESRYHETMFKLMTTDGLTQVYNKRFFMDALERELHQAARDGLALCVLLMDLDHFKAINDTYGHLAGDAVLADFAHRANSMIRSGEIFARFGGEEFALLCSRTTLPDAANTAERIRLHTQAAPLCFEGHSIPVTVSIGIAATDGSQTQSAQSVLQIADEWLYAAKNGGRNQIQFDKGTP